MVRIADGSPVSNRHPPVLNMLCPVFRLPRQAACNKAARARATDADISIYGVSSSSSLNSLQALLNESLSTL